MATRSSAASLREDRDLRVNDRLAIPRGELVVRATRASGAGGQHVNKTSTRVEITWNVATSQVLEDVDRARIAARLSSRLSEDGELRIVASDTRSQLQNRELAESRLADLVRRALLVPKPRKKTRPSRAAKQARLDDKRRTSDKKRVRRSNTDE
ncbi:MAG: alternative ribosome rescue aminoacyl-tRNA hydrolase ArfB [Gemmatimonadaceae bacterium]